MIHSVKTTPLPPGSTGLSRSDNTRTDQLIDLVPDDGVLHVVLERGRIGLSLLQDRLHHRVAHNLLYRKLINRTERKVCVGRNTNSNFWIPHSSLHDIIIRFSLSLSELSLLAFPDLVLDLLRMRPGIVVLSGLLQGFDSLDVVPHRVQDM